MVFSKLESSLAFRSLAMDTNLFWEEVEEDVNMTTDSCVVNVCVVLGIFFVAICTILDKSFDAIIRTILDCESHQCMAVALKLLVKNVEANMRVSTVEKP